MASSFASYSILGSISHAPTMACNMEQLDTLNEVQIDFANLTENGFNFFEDFAGIRWTE